MLHDKTVDVDLIYSVKPRSKVSKPPVLFGFWNKVTGRLQRIPVRRYPTIFTVWKKLGKSPRLVILSRKALGQSCTEMKFLRNRSNDS